MSGHWTVRLERQNDIPADFLELLAECKSAGKGISVTGLTLEASGQDQVQYLGGLARLLPGLRLVVRRAGTARRDLRQVEAARTAGDSDRTQMLPVAASRVCRRRLPAGVRSVPKR